MRYWRLSDWFGFAGVILLAVAVIGFIGSLLYAIGVAMLAHGVSPLAVTLLGCFVFGLAGIFLATVFD